MDGNSIVALSDLLNPPKEESDDELDCGVSPYATPGCIGGQPPPTCTTGSADKSSVPSKEDKPVEQECPSDSDDPRPEPEYEVVFRQAVGAEDVFLGMGNKNPTTASCEELVVKIKLPGIDVKDVDLDVTETFLDCRTRQHRLGLHLPHKVYHRDSKAKWISDKEQLEVVLKLNREFDFANF